MGTDSIEFMFAFELIRFWKWGLVVIPGTSAGAQLGLLIIEPRPSIIA